MEIKSTRIVAGKLLLKGKGRGFYLADGVYRREDGGTVTVRDHKIVSVFTPLDLSIASKKELTNYLTELEEKLRTVGDDAQLASVDLQNALQKQQQVLQAMSNIAKITHDTAMAIIRNIGG